LFVAIQLISNGKLLRDSKKELEKINKVSTQYEKKILLFEKEKEGIFKEIKEQNEIQFHAYVTNYRAETIKNELLVLLESETPDKKIIFSKLSEIVNTPDKTSILIYTICLAKYTNDTDIIRVCKNGLENLHKSY